MNEIAQNHQSFYRSFCNQPGQLIERPQRLVGNWNGGRSKRSFFAEMQIGNKCGPAVFPPHRSLRHESDGFAGQSDRDRML